jgi:hypothetical protein
MADATGVEQELMQVSRETVLNQRDLIRYLEMNGLSEVHVDERGSTADRKNESGAL